MRKNRKGEIILSEEELENIRKYQFSQGVEDGKFQAKKALDQSMIGAKINMLEHAAVAFDAISHAVVALKDIR